MQFNWIVFGVGSLGGVLAEVLKWYQLKEQPNPPAYFKSGMYWAITVIMALAGGLLAVIQQVDPKQLLLALNIGISAPMILKGLAAATPIQPPQAGGAPVKPRTVDIIAGR